MFGRRKKDPGPMIEATAIITDVRDLRAAQDQSARVRLTLNVQPACGDPWEITKKLTIAAREVPQVGDPVRVRYLENAREELAVQSRGEALWRSDRVQPGVDSGGAAVRDQDRLGNRGGEHVADLREARQQAIADGTPVIRNLKPGDSDHVQLRHRLLEDAATLLELPAQGGADR